MENARTTQTERSDGQERIIDFLREADAIRPATGFQEKVKALLSILSEEERVALRKRSEQKGLAPAVGNEGLVMMLIQSLWMQETHQGRDYYQHLKAEMEEGHQNRLKIVAEFKRTARAELAEIKRWMNERSYSEKLAAVIVWHLINKEHLFEGPDKHIGNKYFAAWEQDVIAASQNPETLPAELVPVTRAAASWLGMEE